MSFTMEKAPAAAPEARRKNSELRSLGGVAFGEGTSGFATLRERG